METFGLNLKQTYTPTVTKLLQNSTAFSLEESQKEKVVYIKKKINIVLDDVYAKMGNEKYENILGPYGLGTNNERGETLID